VTVGGSSPSTLETTTGKGCHLLGGGTNVFTVNDATGDSAADLIVQTILRNGSGDYPGVGTLVKEGEGTMLLTGNHVYTGATTVSNGTLLVTGSLGTGPVTVAGGATLGGNGNLGGSLTIQSGGTHALAVATSPASQATRTISGALNLQGGNILTLTAAAIPQQGTYILATATGGITGTPGTVNLPASVLGSVAINGNKLELTVGDDFALWIAGYDLPPAADTSETGDPDGDGLDNFTEYAFGLAPDSGASVSPVIAPPSPATGTFRYTRRTDPPGGLSYTCEWSATLEGSWIPFTPVSETSDAATPVETVTVELPAELLAAPALFVRVKAVR
jgi:autotransporter-associated beta strand protein